MSQYPSRRLFGSLRSFMTHLRAHRQLCRHTAEPFLAQAYAHKIAELTGGTPSARPQTLFLEENPVASVSYLNGVSLTVRFDRGDLRDLRGDELFISAHLGGNRVPLLSCDDASNGIYRVCARRFSVYFFDELLRQAKTVAVLADPETASKR